MDLSSCPADTSFGSTVQGCRDNFDFTVVFEQIFFSIIPNGVFLIVGLLRIVHLRNRPKVVDGFSFLLRKQAIIASYIAIQLALLILSALQPGEQRVFFISSLWLALLSGCVFSAISRMEHISSIRSSHILTSYLSLVTLLDIAQARTFWLISIYPTVNGKNVLFASLFTISLVLKIFMTVSEAKSKLKWAKFYPNSTDGKFSPEETSSLFTLGVFAWLNKLFLSGYRDILSLETLYPLDSRMTSAFLSQKHQHRLAQVQKEGGDILVFLARCLVVPLLLPVIPRICMATLQLCQPLLIKSVLSYLQQYKDESSRTYGYGLIGATAIVYTGSAIFEALYWYYQGRAVYMARGILSSCIYKKTTDTITSVEDDKAAVTIINTDVERVVQGFLPMHEFWADLAQVSVACWLLSQQIGASFVVPLVVVCICALISVFLGRQSETRSKIWMDQIQSRVGSTAGVISEVKQLKISGLARAVDKLISGLRADELTAGNRFRIVYVFSAVIGYTPLFVSPALTFALTSQSLAVSTLFSSVAFILLLAQPLGTTFQMYPILINGLTSLRRIQDFLQQRSRYDFRQVPSPTISSNPQDGIQLQLRYSGDVFLSMSEASFGWEVNKYCLKDITLRIPASALTIVVGPVACGKSTLCRALLGEVPFSKGIIRLDVPTDRIGYCAQSPFLTNATIRENIVGFSSWNEERYEQVLRATMLYEDIMVFAKRDSTIVGSNGISLSGGQKQRVAIARALYASYSVCVFDDVLSGLDTDTEQEVFRRALSPEGMLRSMKTTVVLFTHSVRHLPFADHIIALGSDGRIVEQGSFTELMANKKYVYSLGIKESTQNYGNSSDEQSYVTLSLPSMLEADSGANNTQNSRAKSEEKNAESARMMGDITVYRHYVSRMGTLSIISFILFGLGWGFCANFSTIWLKFWSDNFTLEHPQHSNAFYIGIYGFLQVMTLLSLLFVACTTFLIMERSSGQSLHDEALHTILTAPLSFLSTQDVGTLVNLFSQDMTIIDRSLPSATLNMVLYTCSALGTAAVVATASPYLLVSYPLLAGVLYCIQKFYLRTSRQIRLLDLEAKSPIYTHYLDTVKGITTLRAFGWIPESLSLNSKYIDNSQQPAYLLVMTQKWLALVLQLIIAGLAVIIVSLSTQLRTTSTAFTGASLITLMNFSNILAVIVRSYTMLETSIGAIARLKSFGESVIPESNNDVDKSCDLDWPSQASIEINGVSASYNDLSANNINSDSSITATEITALPTLQDINLHIRPGEKVAICGRSGSGKSSLILLLLRLLDPLPHCSTNIHIGNTPLHTINRVLVRERIITVSQDAVFLTEGSTFRHNLDPFGKCSEMQCRSVLELVKLWAFVTNQGGLSAQMFPGALSQGQKQLFSLGRAILRRRTGSLSGGVLLLDEFSSSVDKDTDAEMQRLIMQEFSNYTVMNVSHRLDLVMQFDTVVVLDQGKVVETGNPRELVNVDESRFRDLWLVAN